MNVCNRMCVNCWDNMEWNNVDRILWMAHFKNDNHLNVGFDKLSKDVIKLITIDNRL